MSLCLPSQENHNVLTGLRRLATLLTACLPSVCLGFNGTSLPGLGVEQTGMAGAGTASLSSSAATLRNPGTAVFIDTSSTWDLAYGIPDASYEASPTDSASSFSLFEYKPGNYRSAYEPGIAPGYSKNWRINEQWAWGLGLFGAGIGSGHPDGNANIARGFPLLDSACSGDFGGGAAMGNPATVDQCGNDEAEAGVQLTQLVSSIHLGYRPFDSVGIGVAAIISGAQLKISGLSAFRPYSIDGDSVSDNGSDYAYGFGLRAGLHWQPSDFFGLGIAYQARVRQSRFDDYGGILHDGRLDVPPNLNIGMHLRLSPRHSLFLDMESIRYEEVKSFGASPNMQNFTNECIVPRLLGSLTLPTRPGPYCLGGEQGPGFGWSNTDIYKIGYELSLGRLKLRMGYSTGGNPIQDPDAILMPLAPGVVDDHVAIGASWRYSEKLTIGTALSYAINNKIRVRNGLSNVNLQLRSDPQLLPLQNAVASIVGLDVSRDPLDQWVENQMRVYQVQIGLTWHLTDVNQ